MDKLKMHSPNLVEQNIEKLAVLFPNCVTEATGEEGKLKKAIDFDLLKQELSSNVVEGPEERYQLNWPGKREALLTANAPIAKTLRPCREKSVNFDTTQNLFIEGDNLDALKLLQETYLEKVKMIFIDPPYNTGNDFIYEDDFTEDIESYIVKSNQIDDEGNRLALNTETNGRFHSDWLSMMYPRLKLARNLLRDDGIIFISIGEDEVFNLSKLMNEIFGESNFIANFIWEKRTNRENRKVVSSRHDYIVCFCKQRDPKIRPIAQLPMTEKALANYKNPDHDPNGPWKSDPATAQAGHGTKSQFYKLVTPNGKEHLLQSGRCWLYTESEMKKAIASGRIWLGKEGNGVPRVKTYLYAKERGLTPESILFSDEASTNEAAKNLLKELFGGVSVFDTPKPVDLIKLAIQMSCDDGIVLDFFAGSSSTAHAVIEQNALDSGKRKFILVQLPEECDKNSEAFKAGYKNIFDIGIDRIKFAGKKVLQIHSTQESIKKLDIGFRVLKVDHSNMADVHYNPQALSQTDLFAQIENVKEDRTEEDLLFQVMLDWGLDLTLPIRRKTISNNSVFFVADNALVACFDNSGKITETFVTQLAEFFPLRLVFRDGGFADDSAKINAEQILKQLSPITDIKSI